MAFDIDALPDASDAQMKLIKDPDLRQYSGTPAVHEGDLTGAKPTSPRCSVMTPRRPRSPTPPMLSCPTTP